MGHRRRIKLGKVFRDRRGSAVEPLAPPLGFTPAGQPDLDILNPEPSLRPRHLCGLTIIWGLQPGAPGNWTGGWLYDPQDGVTYDVTAELTSPTTISARVYRGVPLFGRTEILIRDPPLSFDGRC